MKVEIIKLWILKSDYDSFYNDFEIYFRFIRCLSYEDAKLSIDKMIDMLDYVEENGFKYSVHNSNIILYRMVENYTKIMSDYDCDIFNDVKMHENSSFNGVAYDLLTDLIVFEQGFMNMTCIEIGLNIQSICYVLDINIDDVMYRAKEEKNRISNEEYTRI